jgi:cytochrome c553
MNLRILGAVIAMLAVGGALTIAAPRSADAKPEFAASTGKACGACHANPAGGGALKPYGQAFKANGFKLPGKK